MKNIILEKKLFSISKSFPCHIHSLCSVKTKPSYVQRSVNARLRRLHQCTSQGLGRPSFMDYLVYFHRLLSRKTWRGRQADGRSKYHFLWAISCESKQRRGAREGRGADFPDRGSGSLMTFMFIPQLLWQQESEIVVAKGHWTEAISITTGHSTLGLRNPLQTRMSQQNTF